MGFETVVGLEIHVELKTESKLFCSCNTKFGAEPNTSCCPVCTGMPGALPVVNKKAMELCITAGLSLNCSINEVLVFDRKNYFYPDLPKGYQISQLYEPLCKNGFMDLENGKRIRIREIHLEDDAGKLIHDKYPDKSCCDFNRCGVPLIEIVTQPDFSTAEEVVEFIKELRRILVFLEVSDCKMQEGSMRADVNLSVKKSNATEHGNRTELKNLNSVRAISDAIKKEAKRQWDVLSNGGNVLCETRRWDEKTETTVAMRKKEEQSEYRYFPEPDILPIKISSSYIEKIKNALPQLPKELYQKYITFGVLPENAEIITSKLEVSKYFEKVINLGCEPKDASNWIVGEVMRLMKEHKTEKIVLMPEKFAEILGLVTGGTISRNGGKEVLREIFDSNTDVLEYVEKHGLCQNSDSNFISDIVERVIFENEKAVEDYKDGKEKAFGFLMGQCMKLLKGNGNPEILRQILIDKLNKK